MKKTILKNLTLKPKTKFKLTLQPPLRDKKGHWLPGQCGNSKRIGRGKSLNATLQNMLDASKIDITINTKNLKGEEVKKRLCLNAGNKEDLKSCVAASLLVEALDGNVRAISEIFDRTEGKPAQKIIGAMEGMTVVIDEDM